MSNANWESPFDTSLAMGADPRPPERRDGTGELASLLSVIAGQLADSDRRQTDVLNDVRSRLEVLSQDTRAVRSQVSGDLGPAFSRIEEALAHLGHRLTTAPADASSDDVASEQPYPLESESETPVENDRSFASFSQEEASQESEPATVPSDAPSWEPVSSAPEEDGFSIAEGETSHAGTEPTEPWDAEQAEALRQVFEAEAPTLVQDPEPARQEISEPEAVFSWAPAQETAFEQSPDSPVSFSAPQAGSENPHESSPHATALERDWLETKFAEIASRIDLSLTAMSHGNPVEQLGERFELLEQRFGHALQDVATRSDMEPLRILEAQIAELSGHVEQAQGHLVRLDTIEQQIQAVMEQLAQQREASAAPAAALDSQEIERVAELAAEQAASRFSSQVADTQPCNASSEIREVIEDFIMERRQGDEQTIAALDTLQQALIRLLDRVDSIEMAQSAGLDPAGTQQSFAQAADATTEGYQDATISEFETESDAGEAADQAGPHDHHAEGGQQGADAPVEGYADAMVQQDYDGSAEMDVSGIPSEAIVGEDELLQAQHPADMSAPAYEGDSELEVSADGDALQEADEASDAVYAEATDAEAEPPSTKSAIEKLRQDFIADAQRAKAKAAAEQSEAGTGNAGAGPLAGAAAEKSNSGKIFGMSPKLIVLAVAAVLAVSGAALLFTKSTSPTGGSTPAAEQPLSPVNGMPNSLAPSNDDLAPGPRSQFPEGRSFGGLILPIAPAVENASLAGLRLEGLDHTPDASDFARLQQQQTLAKLSNHVGATTAEYMTPAAFLPEDAVEAAQDAAKRAAPVTQSSRSTKLGLPPVTVGPLSLRLAAANGDPSAQFAVAARLAEGNGTDQNFKEAVRWYKRSASQGFAQSQYRLGTLYERGLGLKADSSYAKQWYQRAAEAGNVKSMHNLAVLAAGTNSGAPDYRSAAKWFKMAAERGLADSQYNFGVLSENGLGVRKDLVQAYHWYALAALNGDKEAARRRDSVGSQLTAEQADNAKASVENFRPVMSDPVVNDAFAASEDWKSRQAAGSRG